MPQIRAINKKNKPQGKRNNNKPFSNQSNSTTNKTNKNNNEPGHSTSTSSPEGSDQVSESEQQYAIELYWCIHYLDTIINSHCFSKSQYMFAQRYAQILKSNYQPIIKKRQTMNVAFGDYRARMAEDEIKFAVGKAEFTNQPKKKRSVFVRQSRLKLFKNFKFDFPVEELGKLQISDEKQKNSNTSSIMKKLNKTQKFVKNPHAPGFCKFNVIKPKKTNTIFYKYVPSENTFRFNFAIEDSKGST